MSRAQQIVGDRCGQRTGSMLVTRPLTTSPSHCSVHAPCSLFQIFVSRSLAVSVYFCLGTTEDEPNIIYLSGKLSKMVQLVFGP
ncbi:hypothetical protein J6590_009244 [Homalodisca vitripennis]|nr:hypothetical protein J6590_009244 [Homalodisca vitripennis]